ncbi:hypothetical protein SAMN05518672_11356 [Chitinophaga sp. CF118]|uniref:hypothetical protein n=1 Tax=Chitinophaga sp. CF118 TaxID=1884367 RepID=UPI0008EACC43|nr:hypothetical protein [Chitinophaga sp. CF118]SFE96422.1 hypothetical protein SAMN05518672_11356 [Chitinophaga sp. CF118]
MKNVYWPLFIGFTLFTTVARAQYDDDNVTIHSNRKAKDPFKVGKDLDSTSESEGKTISLTNFTLNDKMPTGIDISDIRVINAVSDSSMLGYVQTGMFNRWMEARPDKPYTQFLQSYVNRKYESIYRKNTAHMVWVIQELRISERTFNMSEKGFLHLKAMAFTSNDNETFKYLIQLDTILVTGGMDVTHKHGDNIADALQILLEQSLKKSAQTDSPAYSLATIREKALQRYQKPALQSNEHVDGIYLTFEEFINDQPSIKNIDYSLEHNGVHFFYIDNNGKMTFIDKFWGVRKRGVLLKQYYNLLIAIEQKQNSIVLTGYLPLARRKNNATLMTATGSGLIGAAIVGAAAGEETSMSVSVLPTVDNIPYIRKKAPLATGVDIETGEFTL